MKRNALTLALLCSSLAGIAHAAYTEGDLTTKNSIVLEGLINNTNPPWAWQAGAAQTDWDTVKLQWRVAAGNATMDFSGKGNIPVLDGYMVDIATIGSVGIEPVITYEGDGYAVTAGGGTVEQTAELKLTGLTDENDPATEVDGKMTFNLVQGGFSALTNNGKTYLRATEMGNVPYQSVPVTNANYITAVNRAYDNAKQSKGWASSAYASFTGSVTASSAASNGWAAAINSDIVGGYHAFIHSAKVTFPSGSIPEVWSGALSVTVAYR